MQHDSSRTTELTQLQESIFDQMRKECGIRADIWEQLRSNNSVAGDPNIQEERFKQIQAIANRRFLFGPEDNSVKN